MTPQALAKKELVSVVQQPIASSDVITLRTNSYGTHAEAVIIHHGIEIGSAIYRRLSDTSIFNELNPKATITPKLPDVEGDVYDSLSESTWVWEGHVNGVLTPLCMTEGNLLSAISDILTGGHQGGEEF